MDLILWSLLWMKNNNVIDATFEFLKVNQASQSNKYRNITRSKMFTIWIQHNSQAYVINENEDRCGRWMVMIKMTCLFSKARIYLNGTSQFLCRSNCSFVWIIGCAQKSKLALRDFLKCWVNETRMTHYNSKTWAPVLQIEKVWLMSCKSNLHAAGLVEIIICFWK